MPKYQPTVNKAQAMSLATECLAAVDLAAAADILTRFAKTLPKAKRGNWRYYAERFAAALRRGEAMFAIFKLDGNSKLPFAAFSTLPILTCPGFGACGEWCYSFLAWRYPAAFFRQLQNTLFLQHCPEAIAQAFQDLPSDIDVRLYVDGDFADTETVRFWMAEIHKRPDLRVYGYSKSWAQLLEFDLNGGEWPTNYVLNMSSGSRWEDNPAYAAAVASLPITRGKFVAVDIDTEGLPKGAARYDSREYHKRVRAALRERFGKPGFSCPGKCGSCGAKAHMCGNPAATVPIGIGIHGRK